MARRIAAVAYTHFPSDARPRREAKALADRGDEVHFWGLGTGGDYVVDGVSVHEGGTYLAMEGPQFSTLAESKLYREVWGCDVIGMTNMPEAKLAREAELCYASVAMITDYDSWHPDHGEVDVTQIIEVLTGNAEKARAMVAELPGLLGEERLFCPHGCDRALDFALITPAEHRDAALMAKLDAVAGRVL